MTYDRGAMAILAGMIFLIDCGNFALQYRRVRKGHGCSPLTGVPMLGYVWAALASSPTLLVGYSGESWILAGVLSAVDACVLCAVHLLMAFKLPLWLAEWRKGHSSDL
jgi:hypothetical protein